MTPARSSVLNPACHVLIQIVRDNGRTGQVSRPKLILLGKGYGLVSLHHPTHLHSPWNFPRVSLSITAAPPMANSNHGQTRSPASGLARRSTTKDASLLPQRIPARALEAIQRAPTDARHFRWPQSNGMLLSKRSPTIRSLRRETRIGLPEFALHNQHVLFWGGGAGGARRDRHTPPPRIRAGFATPSFVSSSAGAGPSVASERPHDAQRFRPYRLTTLAVGCRPAKWKSRCAPPASNDDHQSRRKTLSAIARASANHHAQSNPVRIMYGRHSRA